MQLSKEQFEEIVEEAIDGLPDKFQKKMHNLAFFVENFPTQEQLGKTGRQEKYSLLGLYEGYIQSSRHNFGAVLPDKITIFRMPILKSCSNLEECKKRIINTVKHEIAHHFGSDEKGARKVG